MTLFDQLSIINNSQPCDACLPASLNIKGASRVVKKGVFDKYIKIIKNDTFSTNYAQVTFHNLATKTSPHR